MKMGSRLTFGELESSSRFSSTWFFTFHHSGVTGKKTFFFQGRSVLCVEFTQSPRDSHSDGFSLSFDSTTVNIDFDVILTIFVDQGEGLLNDNLMQIKREISLKTSVVHSNFTFTRSHVNSCYRGFPSTDCIDNFH